MAPFIARYILWKSSPLLSLGSSFAIINPGSKHFCSKTDTSHESTLASDEVEKFSAKSNEWWSERGQFSALRQMNALRVPFIRDGLLASKKSPPQQSPPLRGFSILDVGCGGGLLSEPLARIGATVTGLDPSEQNIKIATEHACLDESIKENLTYICGTVEDLSEGDKKFDAVVCSEVIEHVNNQDLFVMHCANLVKNGGSLFFTTINRTELSYAAAIIAAEYVLGIIPKGTHSWDKFVKPEELENMLENMGCDLRSIQGMIYNPMTSQWSWSFITAVNYALHAVKNKAY